LQALTHVVFRHPRVRIDALGERAEGLGKCDIRDSPADAGERRGVLAPQPPELFASQHAFGSGRVGEVVWPFGLRIRHTVEHPDELACRRGRQFDVVCGRLRCRRCDR